MSMPPWRAAIEPANAMIAGAVAEVENLTADVRPRLRDPRHDGPDTIGVPAADVDHVLRRELLHQSLGESNPRRWLAPVTSGCGES